MMPLSRTRSPTLVINSMASKKGKIKMNEMDTSELFLGIFKKSDEIKAFLAELKVLYEHRIEQLEEENRDLTSQKNWCNARAQNIFNKSERLFKALEEIKGAAERSEYGVIGEIAEAALKDWGQDDSSALTLGNRENTRDKK